MLIDTHAHLYAEEFDIDREEVVKNALKNGVKKILLPNVDVESINLVLDLTVQYPDLCELMLGLHPCYVKDDFENQLAMIKNAIDNNKDKLVAVGEIGLDYYWDTTHKEQQHFALKTQLQWALDLNIPVAIHTREAWDDTLAIIKPYADKGLKGVLHCFSGNETHAAEVCSWEGWKLGIGGVVTYKKAGIDAVLKNVPLSKLVLETDCPYLAPVPFRGKRNEPAHLIHILSKLSEIYFTTQKEIAKITTNNAIELFSLNIHENV